jgi:hypothetical protein
MSENELYIDCRIPIRFLHELKKEKEHDKTISEIKKHPNEIAYLRGRWDPDIALLDQIIKDYRKNNLK